MIKKTKHPINKYERRVIAKKKIHNNASPVYKLLKEKESLDEASNPRPSKLAS